MSTLLLPGQAATITVAASDKLATWSAGRYLVTKTIGYPNVPSTTATVFDNTGANTTAAFAAATSVTIQNTGVAPLYYMTGTGPVVSEQYGLALPAPTPGTLNSTGTLTAALILGGIVTSTTGAAVTATLDTGSAMDAATDLAVDTGFVWTAINTGGTNAFTVTASTGHTIVGQGAVTTVLSGRFLTRKTAADTFVTYRLA